MPRPWELPEGAPGHLPPKVAVARILGPHGIRGEVRVQPLTDDPSRLAGLRACTVRLPQGRELPVRVAQARAGPRGTFIMRFEEIRSRAEAEALREGWVEIAVHQTRPLPPGRYYRFELVGMEVVDRDGRSLGRVVDVLESPAHDLWSVERPAGGGELLIPATRQVVREVDTERRRIVVELPEGLE